MTCPRFATPAPPTARILPPCLRVCRFAPIAHRRASQFPFQSVGSPRASFNSVGSGERLRPLRSLSQRRRLLPNACVPPSAKSLHLVINPRSSQGSFVETSLTSGKSTSLNRARDTDRRGSSPREGTAWHCKIGRGTGQIQTSTVCVRTFALFCRGLTCPDSDRALSAPKPA